jgi:hypothetical protein
MNFNTINFSYKRVLILGAERPGRKDEQRQGGGNETGQT